MSATTAIDTDPVFAEEPWQEPEDAEDTVLVPPRQDIHYLDHQESGVRWMIAREKVGAPVCRGGVLGDDMGLGKTFQTIGLLKNGEALRTLIVCPPALIAGWRQELRACGFVVSMMADGVAAWTPVPEGTGVREAVWLTTYPKMGLYRLFLRDEGFQRVILDEGHVIRNRKTARWAAADMVAAGAAARWILSATPVQNSYGDWRGLCAWLRVTCGESEIPTVGRVVLLRRTMAELRGVMSALPVAPRYVAHDLSIPEGTKEGKLFRSLCDQLDNLMEKRSVSALLKLELYLRIQQFLVHPQIYINSMRAKFRSAYPRPDWTADGGATKWTAVMTEIARGIAAREGTIVFCNFREEMDRVMGAAVEAGAAAFCIRGGMGVDAVGEAVAAARETAGRGEAVVVVVQIVSGGCGLNLQFCRRVLFLSQHWNPAVVHQAVGRAVRIGQKGVVEVHLFRVVDDVFENIDRRMVSAHLRKISGAREICGSLYEGFAPLNESAFFRDSYQPETQEEAEEEGEGDPSD